MFCSFIKTWFLKHPIYTNSRNWNDPYVNFFLFSYCWKWSCYSSWLWSSASLLRFQGKQILLPKVFRHSLSEKGKFNFTFCLDTHFTFLSFISLQSRAKYSMVTSSVLNFQLHLTVEKNHSIKNIIIWKLLFIFVYNLYGAGVFFIMR